VPGSGIGVALHVERWPVGIGRKTTGHDVPGLFCGQIRCVALVHGHGQPIWRLCRTISTKFCDPYGQGCARSNGCWTVSRYRIRSLGAFSMAFSLVPTAGALAAEGRESGIARGQLERQPMIR